jgi:hypothetical protein
MMFKLNNINKLFIVGLLLLVVLWFALPDFICNRDRNSKDREKKEAVVKAIDSIKNLFAPVTDSFTTVIQEKDKRIEYWMKQQAKSESNLTSTQASLGEITKKYRKAKEDRDTIQIVKECDDLAAETTILSKQVGSYMMINHNLSKAKDSLITVIREKDMFSTRTVKLLLDSASKLSILYDNLDAKYKNTLKKSNRQYTVGAGIGYGIGVNGKIQPYIGINVTKTIFRF